MNGPLKPSAMRSGLKRMAILVACALPCGLLLLAGCAVGPDYKRPAIDSPFTFRARNPVPGLPYSDLAWWEVYKDDALQALIR